MSTTRVPTHIGKGRVKQDKNIYIDLIRYLKQQLSRHERAAAVRQGRPTCANSRIQELTKRLDIQSIGATPPPNQIEVLTLHQLRGCDAVTTTRELLENIISILSPEDIMEARFMNSFWKEAVSGLSRLRRIRQDMRRRISLEPVEVDLLR